MLLNISCKEMIKRLIAKFIINNFLSCTRFFKIKVKILRFANITVGENTKVVGPIYFGNKIKIKIGDNCWIGKNASFDGDGEVVIDNNVDIAPSVTFCTGGHLIGNSEHRAGKGIVHNIYVGEGCWIGTRVTIINTTSIKKGCVIGAGSLVNKSYDENKLIAGVPAVEKRQLND